LVGRCRIASKCSAETHRAVTRACAGTAVCCTRKEIVVPPVVAPPRIQPNVLPPRAPPVQPVPPTGMRIIRKANFDAMTAGTIKPEEFKAQLGGTYSASYLTLDQVIDRGGGDKALRSIMVAGEVGSDSGLTLAVPLPEVVDNACFTYDVRFYNGFIFSMGGKLPGLSGVSDQVRKEFPHSASMASGGNAHSNFTYTNPDGSKVTTQKEVLSWSGRMMWVGSGAAPAATAWVRNGHKNMAISYMYHYGYTGEYGENVYWDREFIAGTWHTIKQCYKLNTVTDYRAGAVKGTAQPDGVLQGWFDGDPIIDKRNFIYRVRPDVHISDIMISVFRGGALLNWAVNDTTNYIDLDNFLVTTNS